MGRPPQPHPHKSKPWDQPYHTAHTLTLRTKKGCPLFSTHLGEGKEAKSGLCIQRDTGAQLVDRLALLVCELQFRECPESGNCPIHHNGRSRQIRPLRLQEKKFVAQVGLDPATGQ